MVVYGIIIKKQDKHRPKILLTYWKEGRCIMKLRFAYAYDYEEYLNNCELADVTVGTYLLEISVFFAWLNREYQDIELYRINRRIIDLYLQHELKSGKAVSTVNKKVTVLKSYFDFLWKKGVIGLDPCAKLKRFEEKESEESFYITHEDLNKFLHAIEDFSCTKDELTYYRNMSLVSLHLWGGLTVSEVCNLLWKDILWQSNKVLVGIALGNTRWIELNENESKFLRKYYELSCSDKETHVFQSRKRCKMSPRSVQFIFEMMTRKSGVHVYPQRLRNTFIVHKIKEGYSRDEVANILGINHLHLPECLLKEIS
jgi:integrase/recombinase XerC